MNLLTFSEGLYNDIFFKSWLIDFMFIFYWQEEGEDCLLLCRDGVLGLNRLAVGLLFPQLATSQVNQQGNIYNILLNQLLSNL